VAAWEEVGVGGLEQGGGTVRSRPNRGGAFSGVRGSAVYVRSAGRTMMRVW